METSLHAISVEPSGHKEGVYMSKTKVGRRIKHGMYNTKVYRAWSDMKSRVMNKNHKKYHNWGGRGITVTDDWHSFENFYRDMGDPPSKRHSLDRIDNQKGYSKENCRWATAKQQIHNSRKSKLIFHNGESLPISVWSQKIFGHPNMIHSRLVRGWTIERAMTVPRLQQGRVKTI